MRRLAHTLSGMVGARRLAVVLGVLASFAVVFSLATVLVMMALGFLANRANELDEERTRQAVFGALGDVAVVPVEFPVELHQMYVLLCVQVKVG